MMTTVMAMMAAIVSTAVMAAVSAPVIAVSAEMTSMNRVVAVTKSDADAGTVAIRREIGRLIRRTVGIDRSCVGVSWSIRISWNRV